MSQNSSRRRLHRLLRRRGCRRWTAEGFARNGGAGCDGTGGAWALLARDGKGGGGRVDIHRIVSRGGRRVVGLRVVIRGGEVEGVLVNGRKLAGEGKRGRRERTRSPLVLSLANLDPTFLILLSVSQFFLIFGANPFSSPPSTGRFFRFCCFGFGASSVP
jgi:hypothetical protein